MFFRGWHVWLCCYDRRGGIKGGSERGRRGRRVPACRELCLCMFVDDRTVLGKRGKILIGCDWPGLAK